MSSCGTSRSQPFAIPTFSAIKPLGSLTFEYTGKTRLTVIGPVSRQRYDFERTGARLSVDSRDGHSLATVPTLKRI